jgi:hypothetical protein
MKRGHSNVYSDKVRPWNELDADTETGVACIPMIGGARPGTCKQLPPLALRKWEWEEIGRRMGWLPSPTKEKRVRKPAAR